MRCEEAQELAGAWLDNELSGPRETVLAGHAAECEACRAYIADLQALRGQMTQLGREPAPPGLADRIRARLAEERAADDLGAPRPRVEPYAAEPRGVQPRAQPRGANGRMGPATPFIRSAGWMPRVSVQFLSSMAAVCLLSVFSTWAVLRQPEPVATTQHDVVAAHVRSLLQNSTIQVVSSDSHTVRPWFAGKVEFAPPVKDLSAEGFPLFGGRLDYVDGHRVATLVYHHGAHTISVFVWPENSTSPEARPPARVEGLNVLSWTRDGMVWWAVSDMEPGELKEMRALL